MAILRSRIFWLSVAGMALALAALVYGWVIFPVWGMPFNAARHGNPPLTPAWALECWVWEDDENTAAFTRELLDGYKEHDFPVRTILIDSPWSTRYNDYQVDEARFPNPREFFGGLEEDGYRVVLWTTCNVNRHSKDTAIQDSEDWWRQAKENGYLAGEDTVRWWKGEGGFIDYTNPRAMAWWRNMQQQVFDWGLDGWKLDGAGTLFYTMAGGKAPFPYRPTSQGRMSMRRYMDHYYRGEYAHGLTQNPEFITLARSLDSPMPMAHPEGFAPIDSAPVAWVGDNTHTWAEETRGLERAVRLILESADMGYCVIGSDVAGYHGKEPIPPKLYIRWAQFSTFCGLFLNGGHGERRMWERSPEELEHVREAMWLHTELVPYIYSYVVSSHEGGPNLMRPIAGGEYQYLFGDALLIAPIFRDENEWTAELPDGQWRYWYEDREVIQGPARVERAYPMGEYPVFIREGAIIPMRITREYTGIGARDWADYLTLNCYPGPRQTRFELHPPEGGATLEVLSGPRQQGAWKLEVNGVPRAHIVRALLPAKPTEVNRGGIPLQEGEGYTWQAERRRLIIRTEAHQPAQYEVAWQ